jgi:hypothetical protein
VMFALVTLRGKVTMQKKLVWIFALVCSIGFSTRANAEECLSDQDLLERDYRELGDGIPCTRVGYDYMLGLGLDDSFPRSFNRGTLPNIVESGGTTTFYYDTRVYLTKRGKRSEGPVDLGDFGHLLFAYPRLDFVSDRRKSVYRLYTLVEYGVKNEAIDFLLKHSRHDEQDGRPQWAERVLRQAVLVFRARKPPDCRAQRRA